MNQSPQDLATLADVRAYVGIVAGPSSSDALMQQEITAASLDWLRWTSRDTLNSVSSYNEWYDGPGGADFSLLPLRNYPIRTVESVKVNGIAIPASPDHIVPGYVINQQAFALAMIGGPARPGFGAYGMRGVALRTAGAWGFIPGVQNINVQYTAGYPPLAVLAEAAAIPAASNPPAATYLLPFSALAFGPWISGQAVTLANGTPLALVTGTPATGQYAISAAGYTFAGADAGAAILVSYTANQAPRDVQFAVVRHAALNFKRGSTVDQASTGIPDVAVTRYRDWALPPEVQSVLDDYRRRAA